MNQDWLPWLVLLCCPIAAVSIAITSNALIALAVGIIYYLLLFGLSIRLGDKHGS